LTTNENFTTPEQTVRFTIDDDIAACGGVLIGAGNLATNTFVEITGEAILAEKDKQRKIANATRLCQSGQAPIRWTRLIYENREFVFNYELVVNVRGDENIWVFESEELGLIGFGNDRQDAYTAFCQDFAACWDNIAIADDDTLAEDALDMKAALKALVKNFGYIE